MCTVQTNRPVRRERIAWSTDLVVVAAAMACPLVLFLCAVTWGGVDLTVEMGGEVRRVGAGSVAAAAGLSSLAAVIVLRALETRTTKAIGIWTAIAVATGLLSLLGPLAATTPSATGTLVAMHAIVAVVVIVSGRRSRAHMTTTRGVGR